MKVSDAERLLNARRLSADAEDGTVAGVWMGDIMSRAMAGGFPGMLWVTAQANMNALAVACMKRAACVVLPDGIEAEAEVVERARMENMALLSCGLSAFETAGRLYEALAGEENEGNDADA